jgi:transposase
MMGQQTRKESLFYYFRLEDQIPEDHLLRLIDQHIDLSFVRKRVKSLYSATGRPSIDPEVLLRLLLVGYLYGITSERRLLEEVRMHLLSLVHTAGLRAGDSGSLDVFQESARTLSPVGVFREVFEEIVRRCMVAGLVEGKNLAVDGTMVGTNASRQSRVPRERLREAAQVSRTALEYLVELEEANPVSDAVMVSTSDPDAVLTRKGGGTAVMAYYDNYLIDTASRVILGVEATPALFHQETVAARRTLERVEKLGIQSESVGADKEYGSGEFLEWLLKRGVQPHIPVIDRRHQTGGRFTRDQFRYEPAEDAYYCPEGKRLRYRGKHRSMHGSSYCSTAAKCHGCPQKERCTPAAYRKLFVHWYEPARQVVRDLVGTPAYEHSRRARYKIEALFAELKQRILGRVRLHRLWNVGEQGTSLSNRASTFFRARCAFANSGVLTNSRARCRAGSSMWMARYRNAPLVHCSFCEHAPQRLRGPANNRKVRAD